MRTFLILFIIITYQFTFSGNSVAQDSKNLKPYSATVDNSKDTRVYYSIFVQSFYDSNNDGIGDLNGLISKLDYLKDLGVNGLWLLPVHPSPTYHKYDVENYLDIHEDYGTLEDYKNLVAKAHELDMVILLDLVVNHTSNRHPWFKKAASGNKKYRNYYVWSSKQSDFDKNPYQWHNKRDKHGKEIKGDKYYGFFWWEMPDLNFDEPKVKKEIFEIGRFWLEDVGVDGFRLDAAEHIYPTDEINKTALWWKEFSDEMKEIKPDVTIIGEVWGGSEKVEPYLKSGLTSCFNFELSDTIRKSILQEEDSGIIETVISINDWIKSTNPDSEDAILLTNHDMERVMTEFNRDVKKAKAAATLLLTLPGTPFIYYGEEIGMLGEKPDEYIREPFLWNIEGEDAGQTNWEIPYATSSKTVKPLAFQEDDRLSMYNFYKDLISIRNSNPALNNGVIRNIETNTSKVIAFFRFSGNNEAIVLINLSSDMQRIPTLRGLDGFEMVLSNYGVFKINDDEISLQGNSIFILTRESQETR